MVWRAIDPADWSAFLASFCGRHDKWLVRLRGTGPRELFEYDDYVPLRELRLEPGELVVAIGDADEPTELHFADPTVMKVKLTAEGVERGLVVEGGDGELILNFRTAIAPELVDGPML